MITFDGSLVKVHKVYFVCLLLGKRYSIVVLGHALGCISFDQFVHMLFLLLYTRAMQCSWKACFTNDSLNVVKVFLAEKG